MDMQKIGLNLTTLVIRDILAKKVPFSDATTADFVPTKIPPVKKHPFESHAQMPRGVGGTLSKRQRDKEKRQEKRKEAREKLQRKELLNAKHVALAAQASIPHDHTKSPHSLPGYIGVLTPVCKAQTLQELLLEGFSVKKWGGWVMMFGIPNAYLSKLPGRVPTQMLGDGWL
jgi:hypothetical protein